VSSSRSAPQHQHIVSMGSSMPTGCDSNGLSRASILGS
jgi:hypothetical protein